ncbi:MAG: AI-2E family transporter, partial [Gammaproteobacteria bacterium]|nr:AI-2E family transporter [Gammaproteobacteria bacterium]
IIAALTLIVCLSSVLAPVLTSIILAYLLDGMMEKLKSWRVPDTIALLTSFFFFLAICCALALVVFPMVWKQAVSLFQELPTMANKGQELLIELHQRYPDLITDAQFKDIVSNIMGELTGVGQLLLSYSLSNLLSLAALSIYTILVPILVFFMLKDKRQMMSWFAQYLPEYRPMMREVWQEMDQQVANYIR